MCGRSRTFGRAVTYRYVASLVVAVWLAVPCTAGSITIVDLAGDDDNFGFGAGRPVDCGSFNLSGANDLGVFDREAVGLSEVRSWAHDFHTQVTLAVCPRFTASDVLVEVPEVFSNGTGSTIEIDGITQPFASAPFQVCGVPTIRTFHFTGDAAAFANDGIVPIIFKENGDDIALDYSRLTVVGTCSGCEGDTDCDDHDITNGAERCDVPTGQCQPGTPPDLVVVDLVGDQDNFGFGGTGRIGCVFFNNSDPIVDLNIFDKEAVHGDERQSWTHNFEAMLCPGFVASDVVLEIPEVFSAAVCSTIEVDGHTQFFATSDFSLCTGIPKVRTFRFTGADAAFASDGAVEVKFNEDGVGGCHDDIALDYSRLTVVGTCVCQKDADCSDPDPCTADSCDLQLGCQHVHIPGCCNADVECLDTTVCNGIEACDLSTHKCRGGVPLTCDPCMTCDPASGCISGTPLPGCCTRDEECNDGHPCTPDRCMILNGQGSCYSDGFILGCCESDEMCDNHDACDGVERCDLISHTCVQGSPLVCDDGSPCNGIETCDQVHGCVAGSPVVGCCASDSACAGNESCDPDTHTCKLIPIVLIPGIMGSELKDDSPACKVGLVCPWPVGSGTGLEVFRLALGDDGKSPDSTPRCEATAQACSEPQCPGDGCSVAECCLDGGVALTPGCYIRGTIASSGRQYKAYDHLVDFLIDTGGYQKDVSLFGYGYDWRRDIATEADTLARRLAELLPIGRKYDVIAHSQGGLLMRAYLKRYPFDRDLRTVIFLSTPHGGAPRAYGILKGYSNLIRDAEFGAVTGGLRVPVAAFLSANFPAVYELLPRYDFVLRPGPNLEPFVSSYAALANGQLVEAALQFHDLIGSGVGDRRVFQINGSGQRTLEFIDMTNAKCPKGRSDPFGDGTVPSRSLNAAADVPSYFVEGEHGALPGYGPVQQKTLALLRRRESDPVAGVFAQARGAGDGWHVTVCSPVRMRIRDTGGNATGAEEDGRLSEGIPGSSHFLFDGHEDAFIPMGDQLTIEMKATGAGAMTLSIEHLGSGTGEAVETFAFPEIPISERSRAEVVLKTDGVPGELSLDVDGDGSMNQIIGLNREPGAALCATVLGRVLARLGMRNGIRKQIMRLVIRAEGAAVKGKTERAKKYLKRILKSVNRHRGRLVTMEGLETIRNVLHPCVGDVGQR